MAACVATREAVWLRGLYADLGFPQKAIHLRSGNTSSLALMRNPVEHDRTKHIDIQYHFTRDALLAGHVWFSYIPTANFLTKGVPRLKMELCGRLLGIKGDWASAFPHLSLFSFLFPRREGVEKRTASQISVHKRALAGSGTLRYHNWLDT
eukprot:TRINITY_DN2207_c0_g1_i1.p1 TRINITY_DN2207_c0_g1~~TRINITY_DN2207_c0_g1_i1.p1  ORF type:complete len:151 (+),score=10.20 TRINITY_DN2207_c0_g1_i1:330-782(+)